MNKKTLFTFIIASLVMIALPANVWAGNPVQEVTNETTLPYPRAEEPVPASVMEYDSVAHCFVVRDTIVGSTTRSGATVVTRAATAYTEDGVKYGYYGDQFSSENMAEMQQLLETWNAEFRNLDINGILNPAPDDETWYMQIVGVDNDDIDDNDGEMRIYNDIGTYWNYKTIAIDSFALRGNEHIKKVVFEDCASNTANANTKLKMVIHSGAFQGCKNLKEFNMYYLVTEGSNHYQMLLPTDVYVGSNVFDNCHEDFRIVVAPQVYQMFLTDPNWCQYADRIVASDYLPTVEDPIVHEGVTYDYAAKSLNTLPTSELTRLQSSWWNALIIGVEVAIAILTMGTANSATTAAQQSASAAVGAAQQAFDKALVAATAEIGDAAFTISNIWNAASQGYIGVTNINAVLASSSLATLVGNVSTTSSALFAKEIALAAAMSNYANYMMAAGVTATSAAGINGLSYVANTVGNKARRESTWALQGQWLMTENKHTIYHMYVRDVENKETVTLYNDIGTVYNYKTVAIGGEAFHNKTNLKTLKFKDVNTGEMYASMTVLIPDSAFYGCTSLETLDLIMQSDYTDRKVALGPENFILCGEDIFAGCDTSKLKIRIGSEFYEDFAENPVWGRYKDCFEVVDVPEKVDFTDFGAQYSYSFENNTLKKQSYMGPHTIEHLHIIGQNGDLESQKGEVGLFNDIGIYNNYKLDYVKEKAFYGSKELTGISMFDLKGFGATGDAYTDLALVLCDSAFAYCPNLEYINMLYFRTDGDNGVEPMEPGRVQLGKGVFAGSDNFKVKMVTTAVDDFKADTAWAKYEDRFLPCYIVPQDPALEEIFEDCGMKYSSPITGGGFDVYDVMKVTDFSKLDGKFSAKDFAVFREFKAFECANLDYVGSTWFKDCKKMQAIELPTTVDSIGKQAFYNCVLLDDVEIPATVTVIQDEAFKKCAELRSVTFLAETPATLGVDVFAELPDDYVLYVPETSVEEYLAAWPQYADHIQTVGKKHKGIVEVTLTEPGTLAEALGLTITGRDPLTIDGNYNKYDSLKIVGPINGTDVGVIRFMGGRDVNNCEVTRARNLKYLDLYDAHIRKGGEDYNQDGINDRITEDDCIDTYMFWQLDVLETLILPKSVTKIKEYAFNHCNDLSRLVIGDNTKSIDQKVTHDCSKLNEIILLCDERPDTDGNAWSEDSPVGVFYVPNACKADVSGSRVYYSRGDSITSPFMDDVVLHALAEKRIYTIYDLMKLKDVENLVNGNTEVKLFNELMFAVDVTELGDSSLCGCSALEEVSLPYMLDTISAGAFSGCTSLTRINVTCDSIPSLAADAFEDLPGDFVIYVVPGQEDNYRSAWPQYADHIQILRQRKEEIKVVTVTAPGTLAEELGFTVTMSDPDDVGRISGDLISINALKVVGPINGKDIAVLRMLGGRDEEDGKEVTLARMTYLDLYDATICTDPHDICFNRDGKNDYVENDNEIPEYMFWKLDRLRTVILPKNVIKIDDNAFYDCLNIENIVVGDATKSIGNDAFGECPNLQNIVFLCNDKPNLDSDAFTDPISDQPYQVEKMFVPASLYAKYVGDEEYTTHAKEICMNYADDALFRAYGSHAVMSDDQLRGVTNVDGWFDYHVGVKDLTSLGISVVDSIKATTLSSLPDLQKITLPATLSVVENGAFANNEALQWADFAQCANEGVLTENNIHDLGINEHALIYAPQNFAATDLTNVVYGSENNLKCARFVISDSVAYSVPREFTAYNISYDRLFVKDEMTTLCLPFAMEVPSGAKAYMQVGTQGYDVLVSQVDRIRGMRPYVILPEEDVTFSTSTETLVPTTPNRLLQVSDEFYAMLGTLRPISGEEAVNQRMYILGNDSCWYLKDNATVGEQALSPYHVFMQAVKPNMPDSVRMKRLEDLTTDDMGFDEETGLETNLVLEDSVDYTSNGSVYTNLLYKRTLAAGKYDVIVIPFTPDSATLANYSFYVLNGVEEDKLYFKEETAPVGGVPYLFALKDGAPEGAPIRAQHTRLCDKVTPVTVDGWTMDGTLKGLSINCEGDDDWFYEFSMEETDFNQVTEMRLYPWRAYIVTPAGVDKTSKMEVIIGDKTGMDDLQLLEDESAVVYDLQGRRVINPTKGLYIVNGQKVYVK